jgi:hypothetical protein
LGLTITLIKTQLIQLVYYNLQRKGGEENQSEEPLTEMAALEIQSTRSSMPIQGKMLLVVGSLIRTHPCRCRFSYGYGTNTTYYYYR